MDITKIFIIDASVLCGVGMFLIIPKKTQPIGYGIIAGGVTYLFFAAVSLFM